MKNVLWFFPLILMSCGERHNETQTEHPPRSVVDGGHRWYDGNTTYQERLHNQSIVPDRVPDRSEHGRHPNRLYKGWKADVGEEVSTWYSERKKKHRAERRVAKHKRFTNDGRPLTPDGYIIESEVPLNHSQRMQWERLKHRRRNAKRNHRNSVRKTKEMRLHKNTMRKENLLHKEVVANESAQHGMYLRALLAERLRHKAAVSQENATHNAIMYSLSQNTTEEDSKEAISLEIARHKHEVKKEKKKFKIHKTEMKQRESHRHKKVAREERARHKDVVKKENLRHKHRNQVTKETHKAEMKVERDRHQKWLKEEKVRVAEERCLGRVSGWDEARREGCCTRKGVGCSSPESFECTNATLPTLGSAQREHCCMQYDVGCDDIAESFHCDWSASSERRRPQQSHRQWCCAHQNKLCPSSAVRKRDAHRKLCDDRRENGSLTAKEQRACCTEEGIACAEMYDCYDGSGVETWLPEKRVWCCRNEDVSCAHTCSQMHGVASYMDKDQVQYCCAVKGVGCDADTHDVTPRHAHIAHLRLKLAGYTQELFESPKQTLRDVRWVLLRASEALRSGPDTLHVTAIGVLMPNGSAPGVPQEDVLTVVIPESWNAEQVHEEQTRLGSVSRSAEALEVEDVRQQASDSIYADYYIVGSHAHTEHVASQIRASITKARLGTGPLISANSRVVVPVFEGSVTMNEEGGERGAATSWVTWAKRLVAVATVACACVLVFLLKATKPHQTPIEFELVEPVKGIVSQDVSEEMPCEVVLL